MASEQDVDGDGLLDLVVHVDTEGLQLTEADTQAGLSGETFDGVVIVGSDAIRVVAALHVDGGPAEGAIAGDLLTHGALDSAVEQSVAHWAATGVDRFQVDALTKVDVQIADLPGSLLGVAALNIVWIDRDAAGYGWSADSGGVDLVSAVTHEFGRVLGVDHHDDQHGVMGETLSPRMPHTSLPDPLRALFAQPLADHSAVFEEVGSALGEDGRLAADLAELLALDVTSTTDSTGATQRGALPSLAGSNALEDLHFTEFDPARLDDDLSDELVTALAQ